MEVVLSVPEAELEAFPEEVTKSSGQQEQSSESSRTQGTVKSLFSVEVFPTADLLERVKQGRLYYLDLDGVTPKTEGGSNSYNKRRNYSKRPRLLVTNKPTKLCKQPGRPSLQSLRQ